MTQPRVPGLDPAIQERAGLTDAQAEALALGRTELLRTEHADLRGAVGMAGRRLFGLLLRRGAFLLLGPLNGAALRAPVPPSARSRALSA